MQTIVSEKSEMITETGTRITICRIFGKENLFELFSGYVADKITEKNKESVTNSQKNT
ncbi:MAG: hypothetical protein ACI4SF_09530 [Oscillospiraceae bacterium]